MTSGLKAAGASVPSTLAAERPETMRFVVCDHHLAFAEAMAAVLAQRGHAVAEVTDTPARALAACRRHRPDICLMDLEFPHGDGVHGIGAMVHDGTVVLAMTAVTDGPVVRSAFGAGASGVVSKASGLARLLAGIERVAAGEHYCDPALLRTAMQPPRQRDDPAALLAGYLTAREREVLERMVRGESTATMCAAMGVSVTTVRSHVQAVLSKLNVNSRLAAVAFATTHGIVTPPGHRTRARSR